MGRQQDTMTAGELRAYHKTGKLPARMTAAPAGFEVGPEALVKPGDPVEEPLEHDEQVALMKVAAWRVHQNEASPWGMLYAIPNGGGRTKAEGGRLKAEGVRPGVPDLHLPVARGGYHGLYIELKRRTKGRVSKDQREWMGRLEVQGYCCRVCRGSDEAVAAIEEYLAQEADPFAGLRPRDRETMAEVATELRRARVKHAGVHPSVEHSLTVIREEYRELEEEVFRQPGSRNFEAMDGEAVQVSAMGIRFTADRRETARQERDEQACGSDQAA